MFLLYIYRQYTNFLYFDLYQGQHCRLPSRPVYAGLPVSSGWRITSQTDGFTYKDVHVVC